MALRLDDVLRLDSVRAADPVLLAGRAESAGLVKWAHSSEIYEIAPLLSGGELLLTTGLGLAGADAGARRHWIRDVAARGVAAVAMEPGRSFITVPDEVVDEARRCDLPFVVLHRVVPFIEICRDVNGRIVESEVARLRRVDAVVQRLHQAVQSGHGLARVMTEAATTCGAPAVLVALSGRVVAAAGVSTDPDERRPRGRAGMTGRRAPSTDRVLRTGARSVVRVADRDWGHVHLGDTDDDPDLPALAERLAAVVAILLGHASEGRTAPDDVSSSLLTDLLDRQLDGPTLAERDVVVRAGLAGFHPGPDDCMVGVVASAPDLGQAAATVRRVLSPGQHVLAPARGLLLGLVAVPDTADAAGNLARKVDPSVGAAEVTFVVGPPTSLAQAGHTLCEAHAALAITDTGPGATTTRRTTLSRLLFDLPTDQLQGLADDALGAVVRWDRAHGTDLVGTLGAYLRHGMNVTRAAHALHLRRQSMHQRLTRIEQLLGRQLDAPDDAEYLVVATAAHAVLARQRPPST